MEKLVNDMGFRHKAHMILTWVLVGQSAGDGKDWVKTLEYH